MEKIKDRLLSWANILDKKAETQARTTPTIPFIYPHLALMPDTHLGLGATVGSVIPTLRAVIPTLRAVIPAAVGVDIGCGMIAVRTQFTRSELGDDLRELRVQIERAIPTSAGAYNRKIAQKHIKVAQAQMSKWWITLPDPDLAYLVEAHPNSPGT